jgi:hypothetical protein
MILSLWKSIKHLYGLAMISNYRTSNLEKQYWPLSWVQFLASGKLTRRSSIIDPISIRSAYTERRLRKGQGMPIAS